MDGTLDKQLNLQSLWFLIYSRFNEFKGRFDDIDNKIDTLSQSSSNLNDKVEILEERIFAIEEQQTSHDVDIIKEIREQTLREKNIIIINFPD